MIETFWLLRYWTREKCGRT